MEREPASPCQTDIRSMEVVLAGIPVSLLQTHMACDGDAHEARAANDVGIIAFAAAS